ncbi:MAG: hypothetical protein MZV70_21690 [Desulfobacterales bacterium]|nr:hypothetical protein [Desulfobacterales bacterium]
MLTSGFAHDLITRLDFTPQPVTPQVMESLADKENPQGILAVVRQKQTRLDELGQLECAACVSSLRRTPAMSGPSSAQWTRDRCGRVIPARWRRGTVPSFRSPLQHGDVVLEAGRADNFWRLHPMGART